MKVLVTNHHLDQFRGSECFTYAIANELKQRGHSIDVFSFLGGKVQRLMNKFARPVEIIEAVRKRYDLALINHNTCVDIVGDEYYKTVQTCHDIFTPLEQPKQGCQHYVAVSEEVETHLDKLGYQSTIIRNGIDTERFSIRRRTSKTLKRVLALTSNVESLRIIKDACRLKGVSFHAVDSEKTWDIEAVINSNDLVFASGRGALQAASCGRNVIVLDKVLDGYLTHNNALDIRENNFSGRRYNLKCDADRLVDLMGLYTPETGYRLRDYVLQNHNITKITKEYLNL